MLVKAATGGDGSRGEEITQNVRTIQSVPLRLNFEQPPAWLEIRGEALIADDTFARLNQEREANEGNQLVRRAAVSNLARRTSSAEPQLVQEQTSA